MITNSLEFRRELEKINEWWLSGKVREADRYSYKREVFSHLKGELTTRRAIILLGPRRVGKSVVIKQIIDSLIKEGANPLAILYYSLDDPTLFTYSDNLLKDLIDYYDENIAKGQTHYIFLDEIHSFKEWYKWIKSYYDRYPNLKFILSGSSALSLQKDANIYLKGRTVEIELYPLDFKEFLKLSNVNTEEIHKLKKKDICQIKIDPLTIDKLWNRIKDYFNEYLLVGGFPEWFEIKKQDNALDKWVSRLINDIPKKAIYEDMVSYYGIKNPKILELIFTFIAFNQSRILAYETINEVAKLDRSTLVNYIEFLKTSYLIIEILKFANVKEQMKAKKKFLIIDQGLRNALLKDYQLKEDNIGFIIENLVGLNCFSQSRKESNNLFYCRINDEVDFIIKNRKTLPIEVKYRNQIKRKEIKSLLSFLEKRNLTEGLIITKNLYKKETIGKNEIFFIPAWLFLLM